MRTSRRTRLMFTRSSSTKPSREPRRLFSPLGSDTERNCMLWVDSTSACAAPSIRITLVPAVSWVRTSSKVLRMFDSSGMAVLSCKNVSGSFPSRGITCGFERESSIMIHSLSMLESPSNMQIQQDIPQSCTSFIYKSTVPPNCASSACLFCARVLESFSPMFPLSFSCISMVESVCI